MLAVDLALDPDIIDRAPRHFTNCDSDICLYCREIAKLLVKYRLNIDWENLGKDLVAADKTVAKPIKSFFVLMSIEMAEINDLAESMTQHLIYKETRRPWRPITSNKTTTLE